MEIQKSGSRELQCVGRLEVVRPKPVGFLCGSIPVPTDNAFHQFNNSVDLVPSPHIARAPRYQMIPTETDLNTLPLLSSIPEKVLPVASVQARTSGDSPWEGGPIKSNLTKKGEALAVTGLVEYGDEIDVIAPADIMKQIFKIPYSKARVSIAVRRVGQTLVLNTGPDVEEGEKLIRRHNNQPKSADHSLFLNFAMHSVRMEACDCPPTHSKQQSDSSIFPDKYNGREKSLGSPDHQVQGHASFRKSDGIAEEEVFGHQEYQQAKRGNLFKEKKKNKRSKGREAVMKVSEVKEKPAGSVQESDKYRRVSNDGFLRMLFWQFHNFRMLLGSDLLIFSNEKYMAVSLHLWDISRKVTPLTWLEAWLDNVMASVPELAICYHENGVVQGYELLKTDDIFLLKGSEDGTPAFHPYVVQQNGLSVLRFLQHNCTQDPGAYWLHKSAGEDVIQLFDLSVIPKSHSSDVCHDGSGSLPSLVQRGRSDFILSLGTLLYRVAHRLSLSMSPNNRTRCARFIKQCLDCLDEPDHLVVRALAHEQFARLLLTYNEELELTSEVFPVESEVTIVDAEEESSEFISRLSELNVHDIIDRPVPSVEQPSELGTQQNFEQENSSETTVDHDISSFNGATSGKADVADVENVPILGDKETILCNLSKTSDEVAQTVTDPISSKLAAVHHVSQAIKSLRWTRQLQKTKPGENIENEIEYEQPSAMDFSVCACGDADCIEVCDIREWLPTSKLDDKLWRLVLLLGESYLALGQAFKDDCQLYHAMKVVELACLVYGSMPEGTRFNSSMACSDLTHVELNGRSEKADNDIFNFDQLSSNYLFWAKAWTLVADVFVEFYLRKDEEISVQAGKKGPTKGLKMSSEVLKEVERLKKQLGRFSQNCSLCSLINCSCQSDRASSGSNASSSTRDSRSSGSGRKHTKRLHGRNRPYSPPGDIVPRKGDDRSTSGRKSIKNHKKDTAMESSDRIGDPRLENNSEETYPEIANGSAETVNAGSGLDAHSESESRGKTAAATGGIFRYLRASVTGDTDYYLSAALSCYKEARKAMNGLPNNSPEIQSVVKKKGWVSNELGRYNVEKKSLDKAETAFAEAIISFKEVKDHANIILINCNLGHGRRALAEEMVLKVETLKKYPILHNAYVQALDAAKLKYCEALRFYGAARIELNALAKEGDSVSSSLKDEVHTQFAHTYLKLGILLAREGTVAEVYGNGFLDDQASASLARSQREERKHEISANEAIREALSVYESLGELRRQEAAYAHFQLACYQRDCCLKFLESEPTKTNSPKGENSLVQRVKQYASLAERNWQKSADFYGPNSHSLMYLTILIERSALSYTLSSYLHSNTLLESSLTRLLEGRHVSENTSLNDDHPEVCAKFWSQLQMILKSMVAAALPSKSNKSNVNPQPFKSADAKKLKELYMMSLKSREFTKLHDMHVLWTA